MKSLMDPIGIAIPDYFFQVLIYENENNEYITAGFLFEHVTEPEELPYDGLIDYIVPVDSIEILTGFDFLNELSEFKQRETESVDNKDFWLEKGFH
jgi:DNA/RNA endonuclease G (NUC1)